jgi:hypothetical protein
MVERRSDFRLPSSGLVMISWKDNGTKFNQLGMVKDLSTGGIGILLEGTIPAGTAVTVSNRQGEHAGIVRHSLELVNGQFIGIEFTGSSDNPYRPVQPQGSFLFPERVS